MGYTHYWDILVGQNEKLEHFEEYAQECKELANHVMEQGVKIHGGLGAGHPEFNNVHVLFNGDATTGDDHETFMIEPVKRGFGFCKTARKPYDPLVCACLINLKLRYGDKVKINSDGDLDDEWQEPLRIVEEVLGKDTSGFIFGRDEDGDSE